MNNTTRKHHRTMQEAFGPYTSGTLHEPADQFDGKDFLYTVLRQSCFHFGADHGQILYLLRA